MFNFSNFPIIFRIDSHLPFEDEKTAEILNQYFVSIKVDREERPDIDAYICRYVRHSQAAAAGYEHFHDMG